MKDLQQTNNLNDVLDDYTRAMNLINQYIIDNGIDPSLILYDLEAKALFNDEDIQKIEL